MGDTWTFAKLICGLPEQAKLSWLAVNARFGNLVVGYAAKDDAKGVGSCIHLVITRQLLPRTESDDPVVRR